MTDPFAVSGWQDEPGDEVFEQLAKTYSGDSRTEARICALQAVYHLLLMQASLEDVTAQFQNNTLKKREADKALFNHLLQTVAADMPRFQQMISGKMTEGWSFERLALPEQALLLCAVAELETKPDTPTGAIIKDYLALADAFCAENQVSFIHGVLDGLAKTLRG